MFTRKRKFITYADDVVILRWSIKAIEKVITRMQQVAYPARLVINLEKTKM